MPHDLATVAIAPNEKTYQAEIIDGAGRTVCAQRLRHGQPHQSG